MRLFIRLMLIGFGISSLLTVGVLALSYRAQSKIAAYYYVDMGKLYPLSISDMNKHIALPLAGSRCFDALPTWFYLASHEAGAERQDTGRWFTRFDDDAVDALKQLKCRTTKHLPMYHYP